MIQKKIMKNSWWPSRVSLDLIATIVGAAFVLIGAYLPWLKSNPDYSGNAVVWTQGLTSGYSQFDFILIVPLAFVLITILFWEYSKITGGVLLLSGTLVTIVPLIPAVSVVLKTNPVYIHDTGIFFSIVGGILLFINGARILFRDNIKDAND